jgi:hypothetical protein
MAASRRVELQRQESSVVMQSAASVVFFQPEFNDFLYAPIGGGPNAMPVSVLSALSRLDIDPWLEAATLSALPKEDATQRLANTIARLPGRQWALADCDAIAERLTRLLPRRQQSDTTATTVRPQLPPRLTAAHLISVSAVVFLIVITSLWIRSDPAVAPIDNTPVATLPWSH